jgi:pyochelin biosynthesis protein PchG
VPYFTTVAALPPDVDVACVVVRSAVGGGDGAELAQRLLQRRIHVLQEHPLHHEELVACLRTARTNDVQYHVNAFYEHLDSVRCFLKAARELRARQRPLFIDATCASQVLYPLVDILGQAVGGLRPWMFSDPPEIPIVLRDLAATSAPYRSFQGVIGGVPITLRIQNQIDPANPDNHAHLLQRIMLGSEGGVLTMVDPHGPVLWNPRLHANRDIGGHLVVDGEETARLNVKSTSVLAFGDSPTFRSVFADIWPDAIGRALTRLNEAIQRKDDPVQTGQTALTTCKIWQDLLTRLGEPELVRFDEPRPLPLADVMAEAP